MYIQNKKLPSELPIAKSIYKLSAMELTETIKNYLILLSLLLSDPFLFLCTKSYLKHESCYPCTSNAGISIYHIYGHTELKQNHRMFPPVLLSMIIINVSCCI